MRRASRDGARFCQRAVRQIARDSSRGRKVCVVFDIDNTLVDTRHRTRAAAKAFARSSPGASALGRAALHQIRYNGAQTAEKLRVDRKTVGDFHRFWTAFFWNPKHFRFDRPIAATTRLARAAAAAGAEVYYLTGRVEALKGGTIAQLARLGLPDADAGHVLCKASVAVGTAPFKERKLRELGRKGRIAWFVTDTANDIAAARKAKPTLPCVLVDFPVGPPAQPPLSPTTPRLVVR